MILARKGLPTVFAAGAGGEWKANACGQETEKHERRRHPAPQKAPTDTSSDG
jgi:hypothetical protein